MIQRLLDAAVEEVGDMGIFLGLRAAQVLVFEVLEHLSEDVLEFFRRENALQPRPVFVVFAHGNVEEIFGALGIDELVEVGRCQSQRHLPSAVGAEIVENHSVIVANRAHGFGRGLIPAGNHDGLDEFVAHSLFVASLEPGHGIAHAGFGFAVNQRAVGECDAFPAIVSVHRVVPAYDGSDFADAKLAHPLLQLADVVTAAVGGRIATVHEAMHENSLHLFLLGHFEQRKEVIDVRVDAAVAEQAKEVQLPPTAALHRLLEEGYLVQLCTTRPAPMFMWPTSLLPIWPSGRPTNGPEVSISVLGNSRTSSS
jgi:hypothetical protein